MKPGNKILPIILLITLTIALLPSPNIPTANASGAGTSVQVWSEDCFSNDIDPLCENLTLGSIFQVEIRAYDLPPIDPMNPLNGGINAFDITINYNSTILKALDAQHKTPLCPSFDGCLFDRSKLEVARFIDSPAGTTRLAVTLLGAGNRVDSSDGFILFRINFNVTGTGFTPIEIYNPNNSTSGSVLALGGSYVPFKPVNMRFENRAPFILDITPGFAVSSPGQSININVTATQVWTIRNFTDSISYALSGDIPPGEVATFNPTSGTLNFTTVMTLNINPNTPARLYVQTLTGIGTPSNLRFSQNFTLSVTLIDVAVVAVTPTPSAVAFGQPVSIAVGVQNNGSQSATFDLDIKANGVPIIQELGIVLASQASTTITRTWNTTGVPIGTYSLSAEIPPLVDEANTANNILTGGTVRIGANFTLTLSQTSGSLVQGQNIQVSLDLTLVSPVTELVSLSLTGLGSGTTHTFTPSMGQPTLTADLTLTAIATATTGTFNLQITAAGTAFTETENFTLTVRAAHDLAALGATLNLSVINPGGTATVSVSVTNNGASTETFDVNVSALPSTGSPVTVGSAHVASLAAGQSTTVTVTWAVQNLAPGSYTLRAEIPALAGEQNTADNNVMGSSARLNAAPTANFIVSPNSPESGTPATFDASQSLDSDGTVSSYSWNFGDGTSTATGKTAPHTYQSAGDYTVTLTVTDSDGATSVVSRSVVVTQAGGFVSVLTSPLGIGIILLVAIVVAGIVIRARRRPKQPAK